MFHPIYSSQKQFRKCHRHCDVKIMRLFFSLLLRPNYCRYEYHLPLEWRQITHLLHIYCNSWIFARQKRVTKQDRPVVGEKEWVEAWKGLQEKIKYKSYWEMVWSKILRHRKISHKFDDGMCIRQPSYAHIAIQAKNVFLLENEIWFESPCSACIVFIGYLSNFFLAASLLHIIRRLCTYVDFFVGK